MRADERPVRSAISRMVKTVQLAQVGQLSGVSVREVRSRVSGFGG
jgi:hypothetical protein